MKVLRTVGLSFAAGALLLTGLGAPAFAVTDDPDVPGVVAEAVCDEGDNFTWEANDPDRYNTGVREVTLGNSNANRSVTVKAPAGCEFEAGDRWRVYNGYFSAEGFISASEAGQNSNTDGNVVFETPDSNSVAGDQLPVKVRVNEDGDDTYEISSTLPEDQDLVLLRRTIFKSGSTDNRVNFGPEPYSPNAEVTSSGKLLRADWSHGDYDGYNGRTVGIQVRTDVPASTYSTHQRVVTADGGKVSSHLVLADVDAATPDGGDVIVRARYGGNGTSSGNVSTGDRLLAE